MIELALQVGDTWELLGDYETDDAVLEAVRAWAGRADTSRDGAGTAVFGISADPRSGHYETRVEVYADGTLRVP